ncbi:hypothetical protein D3C76_1674240 [compost metagenome]
MTATVAAAMTTTASVTATAATAVTTATSTVAATAATAVATATSTVAATATTAVTTSTTTATIFGVGTGTLGNRIGDQNEGGRQHAADGQRQ